MPKTVANEILNDEPYRHGDAEKRLAKAFIELYSTVNCMMIELGAKGKIDAINPCLVQKYKIIDDKKCYCGAAARHKIIPFGCNGYQYYCSKHLPGF